MCFSFRSSIISYIIGICASIFAISTRQILLGVFILTYCQIQLSEAIIWYGIDNNNKNINKFGTILNKHLLILHLLSICIGIILSKILISKQKLIKSDYYLLSIGIIYFIIGITYYNIYKPKNNLTYPHNYNDKNCKKCQYYQNRLDWKYKHSYLYLISFLLSLIICYIYIKPRILFLILSITYISTLLSSLLIFNKTGLSSVFCFFSSYISPIIVLLIYLHIKDMKNSEILI